MKAVIVIILLLLIGYFGFVMYQGKQAAQLNNEAVRLMDEGRHGEAAALLEKARRSDPGNAALLRNLAEAYDEQGDYQRAIGVYRDLVTKTANPPADAKERLAFLETEGDALIRARERVARLKAAGFQDDGATLDQTLAAADASWHVGNWQHAIMLYERALVKDPADTGVLRRIEEIEEGLKTGKLK